MADFLVACRTKDGTKGLFRVEGVDDHIHARKFIEQEDPDLQACLILVVNNPIKIVGDPDVA